MPPPPPPAPSQFSAFEEKLIKLAKQQPNAPNYTALAILYWEKAFKDYTIAPELKSKLISDAIAHTDTALSYDAEYVQALVYKNILLRMQAQTADPLERDRLLAEADRLRNRSMELRKMQQATGQGNQAPPPGMPPPPPPPPPPFREAELVDGEAPLRVGGNIKVPTKVRDVRPVYPPDAQLARIQGVVIIEATIDREGRIRNAFVLRSIPLLDEAALDAVRQWEFTPTLLNGEPKPVIMTVTVNFTLQQ